VLKVLHKLIVIFTGMLCPELFLISAGEQGHKGTERGSSLPKVG